MLCLAVPVSGDSPLSDTVQRCPLLFPCYNRRCNTVGTLSPPLVAGIEGAMCPWKVLYRSLESPWKAQG